MKKYLSISVLLAGIFIGLLLPNALVIADDSEEDPSVLEEQVNGIADSVSQSWAQTKECAKGFPKFLTTVIDLGSFIPDWKDVFTKNMCFLNDVFELEDQLNAIQAELRNSYYSCDYTDIDSLKNQYKIKKAEIYFVRHSVGFDVDSLNSNEIDDLKSVIAQYLAITLKTDMKERYVEDKGWFSENEFDDYFDSWVEQYEDKILKYIDCDYAGWSEVTEKVNELGEVFSSLKKDEESISTDTTSAPDGEEDTSSGLGAKDTAGSKVGNYFKKHLGLETSFVTNVPKNLKNLFKKKNKDDTEGTDNTDNADNTGNSDNTDNTDNADGNSYDGTITSLYDEYISAVNTYDNEYLEAELMAKYATLYGEGGADITDSFVKKLEDLSGILKGSYESNLPDVTKMTKKISKKQCSD